jgi:hypothetical protein
MRNLSAWDLLNVWERGWAQTATQRALLLLAAASPDTPTHTLAELSIGQRDGCLLALRELVFGPQLVCLATCPACRERLELNFCVADIRTAGGADEARASEPISLSAGGCEALFRLPNSLDLAAIASHQDAAEGRRLLLARCLVYVRRDGEALDPAHMPEDVVSAVVERMAQADPQADVQLDLSCPVCDHEWRAAFDIGSFFWGEIDAWAHRTLHQVHALATAYGWREADILNMSPWRRQYYLEMVGAA